MSDVKPRRIGKNSRLFLLLLSEVNLLLGALFFVQPTAALGLWPWPVKELALRFIGAIFLAITLGCWTALRVKFWQRAKILILVGAAFFAIESVIAVQAGLSNTSSPSVWIWTAYFAGSTIGLLAILNNHGWFRRPQDRIGQDPPWNLARIFLVIQTTAVGVFGSAMLLFPEFAQQQFWPWDVAVPTLQTFAALFLATCLATGWGLIQTERARIKALLPLDAIFPSLALLAVGVHWNIVETETPNNLVSAVWVFLYSFVALGSTLLLLSARERND